MRAITVSFPYCGRLHLPDTPGPLDVAADHRSLSRARHPAPGRHAGRRPGRALGTRPGVPGPPPWLSRFLPGVIEGPGHHLCPGRHEDFVTDGGRSCAEHVTGQPGRKKCPQPDGGNSSHPLTGRLGGYLSEPLGEVLIGAGHKMVDGRCQKVRLAASLRNEKAQEVSLAVKFGQVVAGGDGQLGFDVPDPGENLADIAQSVEAREVAGYTLGENGVLGGEMVVEPARARAQAGGSFDLRHARAAEATLGEEPHGFDDDLLTGWG